MKRLAILLIALLPLFGCSAVPQPPPVDYDAGSPEAAPEASQDAAEPCYDPVACSCKNLCDLGCSECSSNCASSLEQILIDRVMVFSTDCVIAAETKEQVRACPGIRCE